MYWTLFLTFLRIGAFTIGGGYAMLPLIQREVVKHKWLTEEEFFDIFAVTQSLPGVFAVNISVFVGYRIRGIRGSLICALGTILPSFIIILAIALFFTQARQNSWVEKIFKGLRPAVVALIAAPCVSAIKSMKISLQMAWIPLLSAGLIWLVGISPIWIILAAGFGGFAYEYIIKRK